MLTGFVASEVEIEKYTPLAIPKQMPTANFTKLEISPESGNFMLQPGK